MPQGDACPKAAQPLSLEGVRDSSYVCYASNISMSVLFPVRNHPCPLQRALRTQNQDHFQRTQPLLSWEVLIVLHEWQSRTTPPGLLLPVIGDYMHSRGVAQALHTPCVHTKSWLITRTCQTSGNEIRPAPTMQESGTVPGISEPSESLGHTGWKRAL